MMTSGKLNVTYDQFGNIVNDSMSLKLYMQSIYNTMILGLLLTSISSAIISFTSFGKYFILDNNNVLSLSSIGWVGVFSPIVLIFIFSYYSNRMNLNAVRLIYYLFVALEGIAVSAICLSYNVNAIVEAFLMATSLFVSMNIYGYVTNKNLGSLGSFAFAGLIAVVLISVLNLFIHSSGLNFILPYLGIVVFLGLTAYETQNIKLTYYSFERLNLSDESIKIQVYNNALTFYLDFINLFFFLLRIFGNSSSIKKQ